MLTDALLKRLIDNYVKGEPCPSWISGSTYVAEVLVAPMRLELIELASEVIKLRQIAKTAESLLREGAESINEMGEPEDAAVLWGFANEIKRDRLATAPPLLDDECSKCGAHEASGWSCNTPGCPLEARNR